MVGTTFDPATRYEGSVTVSNLMPNSSLLTVHGWGHTSLLLSECGDQAIAAYLLTGATPPVGMVCGPGSRPVHGGGGRSRSPTAWRNCRAAVSAVQSRTGGSATRSEAIAPVMLVRQLAEHCGRTFKVAG